MPPPPAPGPDPAASPPPLSVAAPERIPTSSPAPPPDSTLVQTDPPAVTTVGWGPVRGYEVTRVLNEGGMGRVLAARDPDLGREVAVKVLLPGATAEDAVRRFEAEARVTARLQHPAIPPVYELGRLPDGRPFLAMKLVGGSTLEELLRARPTPAHDLPRFVGVFEQVCQAVGFAHAAGVIHRDLKPSNVMVGSFGEVQVMDWGLAKELPKPGEATKTHHLEDTTTRSPLPGSPGATTAGQAMGTPAYMPPEQARGDWDRVDARADVFGLGAILCTILTGRPPYPGQTSSEVLEKARAGDTSDALRRLAACRADPDLTDLARRCLAIQPAGRPADGKAVADAVAAYRAGVEVRLRKAEREKAAAAAREAERRRRRAVQFGLAVAVLALATSLAVGGWVLDHQAGERRRAEAEREAAVLRGQIEAERRAADERTRLTRNAEAVEGLLARCEAALRDGDAALAGVALAEVERRLADGGPDSHRGRAGRCRADLAVLGELDRVDDVRWNFAASAGESAPGTPAGPRPGRLAAAWAAAFRAFGVVPGETPPDEAAGRVNESLVRDRLLCALDTWLALAPSAELAALLRAIDPDPFRDAFRAAAARGDPAGVRALADRPEALDQPGRFAAAFGACGEVPRGRRELVLTRALARRPADFTLLMAAGVLDPRHRKDTAAARAGWFRAAVAVRPGHSGAWNDLGIALSNLGDTDGGSAAFREAVRLDPLNANAHMNLGINLDRAGQPAAAVAALRRAVHLDPDSAHAHSNLGAVLLGLGEPAAAEAEFREAIRLDPTFPDAHNNLGNLLRDADPDASEWELREAVRLAPDFAHAWSNLGVTLVRKNDRPGAIRAYREAVRLDPAYANAHFNLGLSLRATGDLKGAEAAFREVIRLEPGFFEAYANLGRTLAAGGDFKAGEAACREALRLNPKYAAGHAHLGAVLTAADDLDGAVAAFEEAVRLNPTSKTARDQLTEARRLKADREYRKIPPPREVKR